MYGYARRPSKIKGFFIILVCLIIVSAGSIIIFELFFSKNINDYNISPSSTATRLYNDAVVEEADISDILEEVSKSIVGISKIKNTGATALDINATANLGLGSGIIISENGYIATNWHVAGDKFGSCYITLENGETYNGNVVWADSDLDLAIVKIELKGLKSIKIGDTDEIKIAQEVYAIGNPIGV